MLAVLQDDFRSASRSSSSKPQQQRMAQYLRFAEQLGAVSSVWQLGPSSTLRQASAVGCTLPAECPCHLHKQGLIVNALVQIVLSELSGQVAGWLLKDADAARPQPKDIVSLKPAISDSLEVQLSTNWLAQHADY